MQKLLQWLGWSAGPKLPPSSTSSHLNTLAKAESRPSSAVSAASSTAISAASTSLGPTQNPETNAFLDIAAVSHVMTMLEKQLGDVSKDVETSVVGVCQGFNGMTDRAQSAINLAQNAVGGSGNSEGRQLLVQMQSVIECLLDSYRHSCEFAQDVSNKLLKLESRLSAVEKTVEDVEEISNRAKLVALNGQIEATRLGAQGLAFQVVAEETKSLAVNAAKTSDSIRSSISQLSIELNETSTAIKARADLDSQTYGRSEGVAKQLLVDLNASNVRITDSLNQTAKIGGELRGDIAKAVMSMQFQDRVSQRIAHVIETLESMTQRIEPMCTQIPSYAAKRRYSEWMKEISSRYTMDSERNPNVFNQRVSNSSAAASCDVELF